MKKKIYICMIMFVALSVFFSCSNPSPQQTKDTSGTYTTVVSSIKLDHNSLTVEISRNLEIMYVTVVRGQVVYPHAVDSKGAVLNLVVPDDEPAFGVMADVENALKAYDRQEKVVYSSEFKSFQLEAVDVTLYKNPPLVGFATVLLENNLALAGFTITYKDGVHVGWPAIQREGEYKQAVRIKSDEDRAAIEEAVIDEFKALAAMEKYDYTGMDQASPDVPSTVMAAAEPGSSAAAGLAVTECGEEDDGVYVVLNGNLKITGITVENGEVRFPEMPGRGKSFPIITKPYRGSRTGIERIKRDIASRTAATGGDEPQLEVTDIYCRNGYAKVTFNGALTVSSVKVMSGGKVYWPSVRENNRYVQKIFILDNGVRAHIENSIRDKAGVAAPSEQSRQYTKKKSHRSRGRQISSRSRQSDAQVEYKKGDVVKNVEIFSQGSKGDGIGKIAGRTVFVKDAHRGDVVNVKITGVSRKYYFGRCAE